MFTNVCVMQGRDGLPGREGPRGPEGRPGPPGQSVPFDPSLVVKGEKGERVSPSEIRKHLETLKKKKIKQNIYVFCLGVPWY